MDELLINQLERITSLTHDFRTPLNAISSALQVLRMSEAQPDETRKTYYHIADRNIKRMDRMIQHFMDYYQMSDGNKSFSPRLLDGIHLLETLCQCVQDCFSKNELLLQYKTEGNFPVCLDEALVEQAFWNLISNAIHATTERPCHLEITVCSHPNSFTISVKDFGCGIPFKDQKRIFEPMIQLGAFQGGVGLGLSIVSEIMKLHKGNIDLISAPGEGSTFSLKFPKGKPSLQESALNQKTFDLDRYHRARLELIDLIK